MCSSLKNAVERTETAFENIFASGGALLGEYAVQRDAAQRLASNAALKAPEITQPGAYMETPNHGTMHNAT